MKKHFILTSLVAIVATGAANADTDVNFAGDYQLGDGSTANVGTALNGSAYTYTYTKSDSSTATVAQNVDPDLHFFTYTDKNGGSANLFDGGTNLTAADFDGTTVADGTNVISHQTIAANETISRSNYEYVDGKGETVTLGDTARSFTETVTLNPTYATVASVDVTDSSSAPVLTGEMYSYTDPDTGAVYHLNATGDEWVDSNNNVQTPDAGTPQEAARDAMVAAFVADSAAIVTAKTAVDGYATAEATAFAAADGVYTTDAGTISTLTTNYGTYTTATGLLSQAQTAQTTRQGEFAADQALEAVAADLYNTPIETVQAATLQDAKDYADGLASNYDVAGAAATAETNANAYADSLASNYDAAGSANTAEQNAKDYADGLAGDLTSLTTNEKSTLVGAINENTGAIAAETTRAMEEEAAIRSEFAAADELTLSSAKAFANAGDELTLSKANAYTDAKVDTLEKNVSGGIAAATALSAVEVSNVKRGEMSVGGGYGYYNGQSAGAFGMAMGLSDNWSVNAGAGIASGDKTQVSFRAGTNYKFKLF